MKKHLLIISIIFSCTLFFAIRSIEKIIDNLTSIENVESKVKQAYQDWLTNIVKGEHVLDNTEVNFWISLHKQPYANAVIATNTDEQTLHTIIPSIIQKAKSHNVPLSWWITPTTRPTNTATILQEYGFSHWMSFSVMLWQADEAPIKNASSIITSKRLDNIHDLEQWMQFVAPAFGYDEILAQAHLNIYSKDILTTAKTEHYAGYCNNMLVSSGSLFIKEYWGEIYNDTAVTAVYDKAFTAIIRTIVKRAQQVQLQYVAVMADQMSKPLYEQVGFKTIYELNMYAYFPI